MILPLLLALVSSAPDRACPIEAAAALPELVGTWQVLQIHGLDRPRPDSVRASSVFIPELQRCLLREQLRADAGNPPYEGLMFWGANGPDGSIQRVFAHSQHGGFGVYQGRRDGNTILLRQLPAPGQPSTDVVENQVLIADRDRFAITSRLSIDGGRTWRVLSRWEYRRTRS
ncbi:MAG TPA: hypothetical protein VGP25_11030 [Gemmatimonadaceae bacterium]|jgi:hypothetical protein|nr:hypothetical protein [Gemmatimonadaceae bacterium]